MAFLEILLEAFCEFIIEAVFCAIGRLLRLLFKAPFALIGWMIERFSS